MSTGEVGAPSRRDAALVAVGFFASSGFGLVYLAVVARWLSPTQNASFLVVWGLVLSVGSVIASVEPEISRLTTAARLAGRALPVQAIQTVGLVGVVLVVLATGGLLLPIGELVVDRSGLVAILVLVAIIGMVGLIAVRGVLVGTHSILGYGLVLVAENGARLAVAAVVVASTSSGSLQLGVVSIVVGCFVWLPGLLWLVREVDPTTSLAPWRRIVGRVGALGLANGLAALVITGFPTVATLVLGGSSGLAELFAVLALARIPLVLFAPVQALLVPVVVRWMVEGRLHQLRRTMAAVDVGCLLLACLGGPAAAVVGPVLLPLVMGARYDPRGLTCGVAIAATCLLAGVMLRSAVLIALERPWTLVVSWSVAVLGAAAVMLALDLGPEQRGLYGFASASVLAFLATDVMIHGRGWRRARTAA